MREPHRFTRAKTNATNDRTQNKYHNGTARCTRATATIFCHTIYRGSCAMPWPRPRRALCVVCLASCESVVSSFGVSIGSSSRPCSAAFGGSSVRGGATSNLSMTGLQDGGPPRKGMMSKYSAPSTAQPDVLQIELYVMETSMRLPTYLLRLC